MIHALVIEDFGVETIWNTLLFVQAIQDGDTEALTSASENLYRIGNKIPQRERLLFLKQIRDAARVVPCDDPTCDFHHPADDSADREWEEIVK